MDRYDLFLPYLLSFIAFALGYILTLMGVNLALDVLFYFTCFVLFLNTVQYILNVTALRITLDSILLVASIYVAILFTIRYPILHTLSGRMFFPLVVLTLWATVGSAILSLKHNIN